MKLPLTLPFYLSRQFLVTFLTILGGLMAIVYIGEALELLRRASVRSDIGIDLVAAMAAFKLPGTAQVILPSVTLFAALFFFWKMTRSHELEVARAAGFSVWNFLTPIAMTALLLGTIEVTIINPLSAAMAARYERMEDKYFRGKASTLEISSAGIWISQADSKGQAFIHAQSLQPGTFVLQNVMVFLEPTEITQSRRIDAARAVLTPGAWELQDATTYDGIRPQAVPLLRLPTELTQARIEESFASPTSISFWQLPSFIHTLDAAGLSSVRHQLYFQSLLAKPFLLAAMVLVAAAFGLRQNRRGGVFATIVIGLAAGLLLYVLSDIIQTLAESGGLPVMLAAWGPPLIGLMAGAAALFHLEDG